MGIFFVYILKSSVFLVLFYLFYRMLLSKETFHRFNRWALLGITALSFILPLIELDLQAPSEMNQAIWNLEDLILAGSVVETTETLRNTANYGVIVMLFLYLAGILCFWAKHIFSFIQMFRLIRNEKRKELEDGIQLIIHKQPVAAFSWMHYIVLSEEDYNENGEVIITHEKAHIHNRHSWDLIAMDICLSLQWFNPAAWLTKQELQNIHEFEADEWVINQGIDAKRYQLLLIKKAVGTRLYSMANSFNHSNLKRRITMMVKRKSNPWARTKYVFVLPLAAIAVAAFARPEVSSELNEISNVKVSDLSAIIGHDESDNIPSESVSKFLQSDENPVFPGGEQAFFKYMAKNVKYPVIASENGIEGTVSVGFMVKKNGEIDQVKIVKGVDPSLDKEALRIIKTMPKWTSGKKDIRKTQSFVFCIEPNAPDNIPADAIVVQAARKKSPQTSGEVLKIRTEKTAGNPLIIVDEKEIGYDKEALSKMDPSIIGSIEVIKDPSKLGKYGKKGKAGVILVTTKNNKSVSSSEPTKDMSLRIQGDKAENAPLIIVDGKNLGRDQKLLKEIDPHNIASITVVKDQSMLKEYGEEGKFGAILVTTKK